MKFQLEAFVRWSREAIERGIVEAYWREVGEDHEAIPLEPDLEKLLQIERAGILSCFTARRHDGELAGFAMMLSSPHLFYKSHLFAHCYAIYLAPEHRGHGPDMIALIEREMRGRGATKVFFATKDATSFGRVFGALGYRRSETSWGKLL